MYVRDSCDVSVQVIQKLVMVQFGCVDTASLDTVTMDILLTPTVSTVSYTHTATTTPPLAYRHRQPWHATHTHRHHNLVISVHAPSALECCAHPQPLPLVIYQNQRQYSLCRACHCI